MMYSCVLSLVSRSYFRNKKAQNYILPFLVCTQEINHTHWQLSSVAMSIYYLPIVHSICIFILTNKKRSNKHPDTYIQHTYPIHV